MIIKATIPFLDAIKGSSPRSARLMTKLLEESVLSQLQKIPDSDWRCDSRANVRPEGQRFSNQMTLGLLNTADHFCGIPLPTVKTMYYPGLCTLLLKYLKHIAPRSQDFVVTTIQLTKSLGPRAWLGSSFAKSWEPNVNQMGTKWEPNGNQRPFGSKFGALVPI